MTDVHNFRACAKYNTLGIGDSSASTPPGPFRLILGHRIDLFWTQP